MLTLQKNIGASNSIRVSSRVSSDGICRWRERAALFQPDDASRSQQDGLCASAANGQVCPQTFSSTVLFLPHVICCIPPLRSTLQLTSSTHQNKRLFFNHLKTARTVISKLMSSYLLLVFSKHPGPLHDEFSRVDFQESASQLTPVLFPHLILAGLLCAFFSVCLQITLINQQLTRRCAQLHFSCTSASQSTQTGPCKTKRISSTLTKRQGYY